MPTATATEFAAVAGMDGTALFQETSSARAVAQDGYDAMLRGDMDAYGGMRPVRRLKQILIKIMPKGSAGSAQGTGRQARQSHEHG